jgi:hypothetical protein
MEMNEKDGHPYHHHRGRKRKAKTFRRKRALIFLKLLYVKRDTLKSQLESKDYQDSRPVIEGELKAIEMVIKEFTSLFHVDVSELQEEEEQNGDD